MARAKLLLTAVLLCCVAAPAVAQTPRFHPFATVITDPTAVAQLHAGDDFFIALASNPTTGYTWSQKSSDANVAAYEGVVYQAPSNGMIGAGGQQIFIFHAGKPGQAHLTFSYARPFEPHVPPAKSVTYTVNVN